MKYEEYNRYDVNKKRFFECVDWGFEGGAFWNRWRFTYARDTRELLKIHYDLPYIGHLTKDVITGELSWNERYYTFLKRSQSIEKKMKATFDKAFSKYMERHNVAYEKWLVRLNAASTMLPRSHLDFQEDASLFGVSVGTVIYWHKTQTSSICLADSNISHVHDPLTGKYSETHSEILTTYGLYLDTDPKFLLQQLRGILCPHNRDEYYKILLTARDPGYIIPFNAKVLKNKPHWAHSPAQECTLEMLERCRKEKNFEATVNIYIVKDSTTYNAYVENTIRHIRVSGAAGALAILPAITKNGTGGIVGTIKNLTKIKSIIIREEDITDEANILFRVYSSDSSSVLKAINPRKYGKIR